MIGTSIMKGLSVTHIITYNKTKSQGAFIWEKNGMSISEN